MTSAEDTGRRDRMRRVKRRVEDDLIDRPGVVAVDIGEQVTAGTPTGRLAIVVSVRAKRPRSELSATELIPDEVAGFPTDVVEEDVLLHPALVRVDAEPDGPQEVYGTVVGGISVGPCRVFRLNPPQAPEPGDYVSVGTLGALVVDRSGGGQVFGLTNFHIACVDDSWSVGDAMTHPSRVDGGRCPRDVIGTLARAALSAAVDGAVIALAEDRGHDEVIAELGALTGHAAARLGGTVRKRGRTTGLTKGVVASTDVTLCVDYGDGLGRRRMRDQLRITAPAGESFGDRGDSGAVVVDEDNRVVGLYFAGNAAGRSGFANPIARVLDELDVDIIGG